MRDVPLEEKQDLLRKYARGLEEIWKRLVDQGGETGDPLELFDSAVQLCEKGLDGLLNRP